MARLPRGRTLRIAVPFTTLAVSVLLACFVFVTPRALAASPPTTMNFQGRLTDASGNIVADGQYNMQFKIYSVASGGSSLWSETRETTNRVQVTNGLFATQLGQVTPLSASLFNTADLYFEITLANPATATCGTAACQTWEAPMVSRQKLATSAYAFNSDTLDGLDSTAFAAASGSGSYIQNGSSPQTAAFNITGTGTAASLQAASLDTATAIALGVGTTNTIGITIGKSAINTTVAGTLQVGGVTSNTGQATVLNSNPSQRVLVLQGASGQTADLLRVNDSSGASLFKINNAGFVEVKDVVSFQGGASVQSPNSDGTLRLLAAGGNLNTARLAVGAEGGINFNGAAITNNAIGNNLAPSGFVVNFANDITHALSYGIKVANNTGTSGITTFGVTPHGTTTIRPYGTTDKALILQASPSQTADLLQVQNSSGNAMTTINANGDLLIGGANSSNSTTAFKIQNTSLSSLFTADTSNMTITIAKLVVSGDLTLNGHFVSGGTAPTIAAGTAACTTPTVSVVGTDTAGLITVTTGTGCSGTGKLATITFNATFGSAPQVVVTPGTAGSSSLQTYVDSATTSATTFDLGTNTTPTSSTTYKWYYHAIR